jgi:hypothetical protein
MYVFIAGGLNGCRVYKIQNQWNVLYGIEKAHRRAAATFRCADSAATKFSRAVIKGNQTDAYRKAGGKAKGDNLRKAAHDLATNCDVQACGNQCRARWSTMVIYGCTKEALNAFHIPGAHFTV